MTAAETAEGDSQMRTLPIIMLLLCASTASADPMTDAELAAVLGLGTPDELPPAAENICDEEPKGQSGLCIAWCEANDCELEDPNNLPTHCRNVKNQWQSRSGKTDLPCELSCPCDDLDGYTEFLAGVPAANSCRVGTDPDFANMVGETSSVFAGDTARGPLCIYIRPRPVCPPIGPCIPLISVVRISSGEAAACVTGIEQSIADQELVCQ